MTFFYTNAQSARLQFYHDHAMGITRLNVYAGEAAGYVLTDAVEQDMINGTNVSGVNPEPCCKVLPDIGIPLVIQDRTWVDADTIFAQDPTWNWGHGPRDADGNITAAVTGDLWYPHVYMSAQNPWDLAGVNAFGRWHYGPWFNPPVPACVNGGPVGCIDGRTRPERVLRPGQRSLGAADEAGGAEPLHSGRGLHGHPHRQRDRLPGPEGGAQGVPVPRPECRQRPDVQPAALCGRGQELLDPATGIPRVSRPRHPHRSLRRRPRCRLPTAPRSRWSRSAWLRRTSMRTGRAAFPIRQRQDRTGS